jgi:hypothetical protein
MAHLVATKALLTAQVVAVWADVAANGVFLSNQLLTTNFDQKIQDGRLPLAVLDFRQTGTHEYGGDLGRDIGAVHIYRVVTDAETIDQLIGKVEDLRNALWQGRQALLPTCQLLTFPTVEFHMDQPLQQFFWNTQRPLLTASVMLTLESGE